MNGIDAVRLLVVDDQPIVVEQLRLMLEDSEIVALFVTESAKAVDTAIHFQPTVILQDLLMPVLDGFELIGRYRETLELRNVPIVVLSGSDDAEQKDFCFSIGANDYLVKLPHRVELLARIRYHSRAFRTSVQRDEAFHCLQVSQEQLGAANLLLQKINGLDGLTGIANRRKFDDDIAREWQRARRNGTSLALLMCDVDNFKHYNDTYGHLAGDECLKRIAAVLTELLKRPGDTAARFGGEEFAILLPDTTLDGALHLAKCCLRQILGLSIENRGVLPLEMITMSIGAAHLQPADHCSVTDLINAADRALYAAKHLGRNTVCAEHGQDHAIDAAAASAMQV